jgi:hypothetical protein
MALGRVVRAVVALAVLIGASAVLAGSEPQAPVPRNLLQDADSSRERVLAGAMAEAGARTVGRLRGCKEVDATGMVIEVPCPGDEKPGRA